MNNIEHAKLRLTAAILNNEKEIEIYSWLAATVPEYGTRPFNQRFITWLNKKAGERFGTHNVERYGQTGGVDMPNVNFYMGRTTYTDKVQFDFSFTYKGKTADYNYPADGGPKEFVLRDSSKHEKMYGVAGVEELVKQVLGYIESRQNQIMKLNQNLADLPELANELLGLQKAVRKYNDKISYAISDDWSLRIR